MWVANSQLCRAFTGAHLAEICGLDADDVSLGETPSINIRPHCCPAKYQIDSIGWVVARVARWRN